MLKFMVRGPDDLNSFHRQVLVDDVDGFDSFANEFGIASGGQDGGIAAKLCTNFVKDLTDKAAVADNGTDLHRFLGAAADGGARFLELNGGQKGGFLVEIIAERGRSGGDDATEVGSGLGNDVKSDGSAEIDDNGRAGALEDGGGGVGEAIGPDLGGVGIINGDGHPGEMRDVMNGLLEEFCHQGRGIGNDGAEGDSFEIMAPECVLEGCFGKRGGWNDRPPVGEFAVEVEGELGPGVGVINEEVHS